MHKYSSFPLAIVSWAHTGTASRLACCKIWRNISLVRGSRMHPSHYPWDPAFGSLSICVSRYYPVSQSFWTRTSLPFVKQHIVVNFPNSHISMWLLVVIFRSNLETLLFFFFFKFFSHCKHAVGFSALNYSAVIEHAISTKEKSSHHTWICQHFSFSANSRFIGSTPRGASGGEKSSSSGALVGPQTSPCRLPRVELGYQVDLG